MTLSRLWFRWRTLRGGASGLGRWLASRLAAKPYLSGVENLIRLRRFTEAERALRWAWLRFPLHPGVLAARGRLAMAREDWDGAIAIWRRFRWIYPRSVQGWDQLGRTLAARQLAEAGDGEPQHRPRPVEVPRVHDEAIRTLMLGFESVGNDCEFGMVQRRFGAEPLGLLRWNNVGLGNLLEALAAGFDGMGDPEHTELWFAGDGSETFIRDKRWDLHIHTFMSRSEVDPEVFFPKACRRVGFLREKFLADLRAGEKVFVFKSKEISPDAMRQLHAAFKGIGKVRVLCVKPANDDPSHSVLCGRGGEVFEMADGLYVGFISHLGAVDGRWNIAFDDWIAVCRAIDRAPPLPPQRGAA